MSRTHLTRSDLDRFFGKVRVTASGCWEWTAYRDANGYGRFNLSGGPDWAHRVAYRMFVSLPPAGIELHHECHNPACVNPGHLRAVTAQEHGAKHRTTHCIRGHEFNEANTYFRPDNGNRQCRECKQIKNRAVYLRDRRPGTKPRPALRTHCPKGHPYDAENTIRHVYGWRGCKACRRAARERAA